MIWNITKEFVLLWSPMLAVHAARGSLTYHTSTDTKEYIPELVLFGVTFVRKLLTSPEFLRAIWKLTQSKSRFPFPETSLGVWTDRSFLFKKKAAEKVHNISLFLITILFYWRQVVCGRNFSKSTTLYGHTQIHTGLNLTPAPTVTNNLEVLGQWRSISTYSMLTISGCQYVCPNR